MSERTQLKSTVGAVYAVPTMAASLAYTDMNLIYHLKTWSVGAADLFVNIQNLFNTSPPLAAGSPYNSQLGLNGGFAFGDDPIGRYFTLGIRFRH